MNNVLKELFNLIKMQDGINNKARLTRIVSDAFHLTKDRSVYYCPDFVIRFSSSAGLNFGNTVLSLSNLRKYDDRPFIVCLVTPKSNYCLIANTTFLKKISHSSQELRENNIRGSFNGSYFSPLQQIHILSQGTARCNSLELGQILVQRRKVYGCSSFVDPFKNRRC